MRFKRLCMVSGCLTGLMLLIAMGDGYLLYGLYSELARMYFAIFFGIAALVLITFSLLSQLEIFKLSRNTATTDNTRFENEKERFVWFFQHSPVSCNNFWFCRFHDSLLLSFIVPISIIVEFHALMDFDEAYASFICVDLLKTFSSALIFATCVLRSDFTPVYLVDSQEFENPFTNDAENGQQKAVHPVL